MDLADRLAECIKDKDVTPYEIWKDTGVNQADLSKILNRVTKKPRKNREEVEKDKINILAKYFQVSEEWLRTGKGEKKSIESNILFTNSGEMEKRIFEMFLKGDLVNASTVKEKDDLINKLNKQIGTLESEIRRLGGLNKKGQSGESPELEHSG